MAIYKNVPSNISIFVVVTFTCLELLIREGSRDLSVKSFSTVLLFDHSSSSGQENSDLKLM